MSQRTSIRVSGEPELVGAFGQLLETTDEAELVRLETGDDAGTGVDFGLETIATLVGIVSTLFFNQAVVPSLVQIFRRKPGSKILIETPTRTVSIVSSTQFSEEEVARLLTTLAT